MWPGADFAGDGGVMAERKRVRRKQVPKPSEREPGYYTSEEWFKQVQRDWFRYFPPISRSSPPRKE